MKKISTYLASALLMMVVFTSCSSSSEDKSEEKNGKDAKQENSNDSKPLEAKAADLSEPCDFADALEGVVDKMIAFKNSIDPDNITEAIMSRGIALEKELNELMAAAGEKFTEGELEDCPNSDALEKKLQEIYN